jgi:tetratricopeptide (TPR) repeat protein
VRVEMSGQGSFQTLTTSVFLVVEDGEYRILGTGDTPELLGAAADAFAKAGKLEVARELLDWAWEELRGLDSDDPFSWPLFPKVWAKGAESDELAIRQAATVLMIDGAHPEDCVKHLEEWTSVETDDHQRRDLLRFALITAVEQTSDNDRVARLTRELLVGYPTSQRLFSTLTGALIRLGRVDEARHAAEEALDKGVRKVAVYRSLARAAEEEGKLDEADSWLERILESADALPPDYNNRAWLAAFRNAVDESALAWAHAAVEGERFDPSPALHTLATLYAERDMPAEAYQVLLQAIETSGDDGPRPHDWYVLGRMAESYGFLDTAATYYQRVDRPEEQESEALSTYVLAQRRLSALAQ